MFKTNNKVNSFVQSTYLTSSIRILNNDLCLSIRLSSA